MVIFSLACLVVKNILSVGRSVYISNIAIRIHPTFLQYVPGSVFPETFGVELGTQKSNFRWVLFLGSALLPCIAI